MVENNTCERHWLLYWWSIIEPIVLGLRTGWLLVVKGLNNPKESNYSNI